MPVLFAEDLTRFAQDILVAAGLPQKKGALVAKSLVAANLRGVDSHGVQLLPFYLRQYLSANINVRADGRVALESGAVMAFDGENGIGQCVADACCRHAVRLATAHGIAIVTARETNHFGAAAYWGAKLRDAGMLGIVMCNASPSVPPWQGREARLGRNPVCVAAPGPWLLDMATTAVSADRVLRAFQTRDGAIPPGWAYNAAGEPTTDAGAAVNGMLAPLGGYKGTGLAMMVETLCGVLSCGAFATELGGIRRLDRPARTSHTFIAVHIPHFMPLEDFRARMEALVGAVKATKPGPGFQEVLVAGELEARAEAERREHGIPVPEGHWESLLKAAERVGAPAFSRLPQGPKVNRSAHN